MRKTPRLALSLLLVGGLAAAACSDDSSDDGGDDTTTTAEPDGTTTTEATDGSDETTTTAGGGGGEDAEAYIAALTGTLSEGGAGWTPDESECMAESIIDVTGPEVWADAGVTPADISAAAETDDSPGQLLGDGTISDDQADDILDGWEDCTDINAKFAEALGSAIDAEQASCVADGLDESGLVREGFKQTFTQAINEPDDEVLQGLLAVFEDCGIDPNATG